MPAIIRVDKGSETGTMATIHAFLRRNHTDVMDPVTTSNSRHFEISAMYAMHAGSGGARLGRKFYFDFISFYFGFTFFYFDFF